MAKTTERYRPMEDKLPDCITRGLEEEDGEGREGPKMASWEPGGRSEEGRWKKGQGGNIDISFFSPSSF